MIKGILALIGGTILAVVLYGILVLGGLTFQKPILNAQTTNFRQTNGYVDTQVTKMLNLVRDYAELDVKILETSNAELAGKYQVQQLAIVKQLREVVRLVNADQVPASVYEFLSEHR